MNHLSWLLYLSYASERVSSGIGTFGGFLTGLGVIALIAWIIFRFVIVFGLDDKEQTAEHILAKNKDTSILSAITLLHSIKIVMFVGIILGLFLNIISSVLPNQKTIALIAASEIGEKIVTNEKVQSIIDPSIQLLQSYMEKETLNIKKEIDSIKNPKEVPVKK